MTEEMVSNPFIGVEVASRYAAARPALHGEAVAAVRGLIDTPRTAVDLGCGTGLSTHALARHAAAVVGIDASLDMLSQARRAANISFVLGEAERLPFKDGAFDLATIASAIHWFHPPALGEIRRVLSADGSLLVYDIHFRARMNGVDAFAEWMTVECGPRYPHVAKNERPDL